MGEMANAYRRAKFDETWFAEFRRMNPHIKYSVSEQPVCIPVACRFCRTHFRGRGGLLHHWCWWDTANRYGRAQSADADNYRGHFPRVKLHLTDHDCALMLQSTWWEQARAIADKMVQHG